MDGITSGTRFLCSMVSCCFHLSQNTHFFLFVLFSSAFFFYKCNFIDDYWERSERRYRLSTRYIRHMYIYLFLYLYISKVYFQETIVIFAKNWECSVIPLAFFTCICWDSRFNIFFFLVMLRLVKTCIWFMSLDSHGCLILSLLFQTWCTVFTFYASLTYRYFVKTILR